MSHKTYLNWNITSAITNNNSQTWKVERCSFYSDNANAFSLVRFIEDHPSQINYSSQLILPKIQLKKLDRTIQTLLGHNIAQVQSQKIT